MPYPIYLTLVSGQQVSSSFALDRSDRAAVLYVSSHTGIGIQLEFSPVSGGTSYGPIFTEDGVKQAFTVTSGATWGVVKMVPTPWGRVRTNANVSATTSVMILAAQ